MVLRRVSGEGGSVHGGPLEFSSFDCEQNNPTRRIKIQDLTLGISANKLSYMTLASHVTLHSYEFHMSYPSESL